MLIVLLMGSANLIVGKFCYGQIGFYNGTEVTYSNPILLAFFGYSFVMVAFPIYLCLPAKY